MAAKSQCEKLPAVALESDEKEKLMVACLEAREFAYSAYSKFRVGAAVLTESGKVFTGCNVENASFGLVICAERTAIVKAVSEGHRRFKAIALSSDADAYIWPCGACRQFISEFGEMHILSVKPGSSIIKEATIEEILPLSFKASDFINFFNDNNDSNDVQTCRKPLSQN